MDFSMFTDEQMKKARECKSVEELVQLAEAEGVELSEEQLEAVSGGMYWGNDCACYGENTGIAGI